MESVSLESLRPRVLPHARNPEDIPPIVANRRALTSDVGVCQRILSWVSRSDMTRHEFGRYLLLELLWELTTSHVTVPGLTDVPEEEIRILAHSGYDTVRLLCHGRAFEATLSWRGDAAPSVIP